MLIQKSFLRLALQELSNARRSGLPDHIESSVRIATGYIEDAIQACEQDSLDDWSPRRCAQFLKGEGVL